MGTVALVLVAIVGSFLALMIVMQVVVRARARAQTGKPAPQLPGRLGREIAKGHRALLYFFSPGCAACRSMTPRVTEISRKNSAVHLVDVSRDLATARALKVMATPSFIEIDAGKVVAFHIGPAPSELIARYAS